MEHFDWWLAFRRDWSVQHFFSSSSSSSFFPSVLSYSIRSRTQLLSYIQIYNDQDLEKRKTFFLSFFFSCQRPDEKNEEFLLFYTFAFFFIFANAKWKFKIL
jgi:hypothetical protein